MYFLKKRPDDKIREFVITWSIFKGIIDTVFDKITKMFLRADAEIHLLGNKVSLVAEKLNLRELTSVY